MHIVIVEDYPPVAAGLERLSRELLGGRVDSVSRFLDVDDALEYLEEHPVDVLLLDLNLGSQDGFEVLKHAVAESFFTIVVSANTHRAFEAFDYGVLDFIGKPVSKERLGQAFARMDGAGSGTAPSPKYLAVRRTGAVALVPLEEVAFIRGAGKYSEILTRDGAEHLHHKTLDRLEALLHPRFVRIHRSYLIDRARVRRLIVGGGGNYSAELDDGSQLPVGRTRFRDLRASFEQAPD